MTKIIIDGIEFIRPQEGDTVILKTKDKLTNEQRSGVIRKFRDFFPGCQVLIFDSGASIQVISREHGFNPVPSDVQQQNFDAETTGR